MNYFGNWSLRTVCMCGELFLCVGVFFAMELLHRDNLRDSDIQSDGDIRGWVYNHCAWVHFGVMIFFPWQCNLCIPSLRSNKMHVEVQISTRSALLELDMFFPFFVVSLTCLVQIGICFLCNFDSN